MHVKSGLVRGGIAVAAASVALMGIAPAALADGAARGRVLGGGAEGFTVHVEGKTAPTKLFSLKLSDGSMLKTYCVQLKVTMRNDVDMVERAWDKFPTSPDTQFNTNRDKINWVLHNGYPVEDLSALESTLDKKGVKLHDGLSKEEAISATQAAVWNYSDGMKLNRDDALDNGSAADAADVVALYDYLTGADNTGIGEQPKPSLDISAAKADGAAGTRIGPFSVATTGQITDLTTQLPDGVKLVDSNGAEVKAADVKDGSKLFVDVPKDAKDGKGSFALKATGSVDTGRLFVDADYDSHQGQSVIVAQSEKTQVTATATATWTQAGAAAPTSQAAGGGNGPGLANTGVSAAVPTTIGVLLLGGGALMLFLVRRRRNAA